MSFCQCLGPSEEFEAEEDLNNILGCQHPLRCSGGGGSDWRQESTGNPDTLVTMMGAGVLVRSRGASGECLMRSVGRDQMTAKVIYPHSYCQPL